MTWKARAELSITSESALTQTHQRLHAIFTLLSAVSRAHCSVQSPGSSLEPFLQDEVSAVCENQELLLAGDVPRPPQHPDHSNRVPPPARLAHVPTRSVNSLLMMMMMMYHPPPQLHQSFSLLSYLIRWSQPHAAGAVCR